MTTMMEMIDFRRLAIDMVVAAGVVLTVGGPLHAAAQPADRTPRAVPVSPLEGPPKAVPTPAQDRRPMGARAGVQPATQVLGIFLEGVQARAGHKLPCGLSYYENPPAGRFKVVVYAIGNCHDRAVSRRVDFVPDRPQPHSNCITIPAHHTVIGAWGIGRNQRVSRRGTGMIACR